MTLERPPQLLLIGDYLWNRFGKDEIELRIMFSSAEDELNLDFS